MEPDNEQLKQDKCSTQPEAESLGASKLPYWEAPREQHQEMHITDALRNRETQGQGAVCNSKQALIRGENQGDPSFFGYTDFSFILRT